MKEETYKNIVNIIKSVVESESNMIANMANITAVIKEHFNFLWIGFYLVDESTNELVLGPFQGALACTRIAYGKGVCGESWKQNKILLVDDVHKFPGHIACSTLSNSEIVIPLRKAGKVFAVLDIDSNKFEEFDSIDSSYLSEICHLLVK
jgi:GAF domain-containing protein